MRRTPSTNDSGWLEGATGGVIGAQVAPSRSTFRSSSGRVLRIRLELRGRFAAVVHRPGVDADIEGRRTETPIWVSEPWHEYASPSSCIDFPIPT